MNANEFCMPMKWVDIVYDRLIQVKKLLSNDESVTHFELLKKVMPAVGFAYEEVHRNDEHPSNRFYRLHSYHYTILTSGKTISQVRSNFRMRSACIQYRSQSKKHRNQNSILFLTLNFHPFLLYRHEDQNDRIFDRHKNERKIRR